MAPVIEGDTKAPFSIDTTPRCREGRYSIPWITPLTPDAYLIMLSVKLGGIKYHFLSHGITRPWIKPRSPGTLANTLTNNNNNDNIYIYIYIYIYIFVEVKKEIKSESMKKS